MTDIVYGPRTRSSNLTTYTDVQLFTNGVGGTVTKLKTGYDSDVMTDVVIQDFYRRREEGELFNNPMTRTRIRKSLIPMAANYTRLTNNWNGYFTTLVIDPAIGYCSAPTGRDAMVQDAVTYTATKALGKCTSEVTQGLVTLGELKETKQMLRTALISLLNMRKVFTTYVDLLFDLRNSVPKQAAIIYKHIENSWMQIRMGWRPLAGEIEKTQAAWNHLQEKIERQTFRDFERLNFTKEDTVSGRDVANLFYASYKRTYTEICDVRSGVLCEMRYGGVPDVWGVTKLPQTVWELTTLSWCVDYIVNVADVIAAYTPDSLWTPKVRWSTTESVIVQEIKMIALTPKSGGTINSLFPSSLVARTYKKVRTPNPGIGFVGRPSSLDDPELLDTIAVVRQKITPLLSKGLALLRR